MMNLLNNLLFCQSEQIKTIPFSTYHGQEDTVAELLNFKTQPHEDHLVLLQTNPGAAIQNIFLLLRIQFKILINHWYYFTISESCLLPHNVWIPLAPRIQIPFPLVFVQSKACLCPTPSWPQTPLPSSRITWGEVFYILPKIVGTICLYF